MSKTYKHIAKYKQKEYWLNSPNSLALQYTEWIQTGEDIIISWQHRAPQKVEKEPYPWFSFHTECRRKKPVERQLWRKYRHKVKSLVKKGEYDLLPLKPEDSSWIIW